MLAKAIPLYGLSVVDFGSGLSACLACNIVRELGATITRAEPISGDPFYAQYPIYRYWNQGKRIVKERSIEDAVQALKLELKNADLCIVGGEEHPGYAWRPDIEALAAAYPQLVILDLRGAPSGSSDRDVPAIELLIQARTGLVFEQFADRPSVYAFPAGSYGAALQGLVGTFAALCERERSGFGQIVHTSLFQGVLSWLVHDWYQFDEPTPVADDVTPKGARPLIFQCADGKYVHFVLASKDARKHVYTVLDVKNPQPSLKEDPRGMPTLERGVENYYDDVDMLQGYIDHWNRDDLMEALWKKGVSAEAVNLPGEPWDDEQVRFNEVVKLENDGCARIGLPFTVTVGELPDNTSEPVQVSGNLPPLAGVKVVDFGAFTAGPHASLPLSDLGAQVIKVEPLAGDVLRFYFLKYTASSRGKKVIALDMKTPAGREIVKRLCREADMVHHNFRPGVTERLGIDQNTLRGQNPNLILLETAAYGIAGPKALNAGFDMIFHSYCGHSVQATGAGQKPRNYRLTFVDLSAAMLGSVASLMAQFLRLRTGAGATIATSLLNSGLFLLSEMTRTSDGRFCGVVKLNADETGFHPAMRIYQCGQDWIAIAAPDAAMAQRLIEVLHLTQTITQAREEWGENEEQVIAAAMQKQSATEILAAFAEADVWAALCRKDAKRAIFAESSSRSLGLTVDAIDDVHGPFRQLGAQFSLSRSPMTVRGDSPSKGQHTRQILSQLNYSSKEIENSIRDGVVA